MINFIEGDLLASDAEALVNTVNTVGIMGKGIALQFKALFAHNYKIYAKACKDKSFKIGDLLVVDDESLLRGKKTIINFPTKTDWRKPSEYDYITKGLQKLVEVIKERSLKSVALPPLGAGNGGLDWDQVKGLMQQYLSDIDCEVFIYQPNYVIKEALKKERVKLTPARAMLLAILFDLVRNGEFVSEFASEKVAYFLKRFGAEDFARLDFQPRFYGPYSGKVKHVLFFLNGSYITGYSAKDKRPFEEIGLMMDAEKDVLDYLENQTNQSHKKIVEETKDFLNGFYSSFGLELLSTVDFIANKYNTNSLREITEHLWNDRKKALFANPNFITLAVDKISKSTLRHN